MRVIRDDIILAESNDTIVIEGNHYFPPDSVNWDYFQKSDTHTTCPWKGQASYCTLVIGDKTEPDAAWYYPEPKEAAKQIKDYVAFYKGVEEN
ncbi:MAG: DUF427 domain-containing protein [Desulfobacterales bacterium]|jgi:uncharacterized protein (DUF427 family)